jgi:hypothetical protein
MRHLVFGRVQVMVAKGVAYELMAMLAMLEVSAG